MCGPDTTVRLSQAESDKLSRSVNEMSQELQAAKLLLRKIANLRGKEAAKFDPIQAAKNFLEQPTLATTIGNWGVPKTPLPPLGAEDAADLALDDNYGATP